MTRANAGFAILTFCASLALAQVEAPVLGYLPDGARIRPVYGIPGAATVAPPVDFGRDFGRIAVSPRQDYAIATDASSGQVLIAMPGGSAHALNGAGENPDVIRISPGGSAAVLWFSATHRAQIVSGLPGSPAIREIDAGFATSRFGETGSADMPLTLAVSDDGQWLAGAWARGVYAIGPNSEVRNLPVYEVPRAMTFFGARHDLALATNEHVLSITDVGGSARVSAFESGRMTPAGIGISADNARLVVADRSGLVYSIDTSGGTVAKIDCGCTPDGVFRLGRDGFRLTGLSNGSFRMLDTGTGEMLFVPLMAGGGQ